MAADGAVSAATAGTMLDPALAATAAVEAASTRGAAVRGPDSLGSTMATSRAAVLPLVEADANGPRLVHAARERYVAQRVIGSGGMGEVTLAFDEDIGRAVAIKHLHAHAQGEVGLARFVEEIRTVGSLEHPNIVPIHDVGLGEDGRYYFVMKHVDGRTLEEVIDALRRDEPKAKAEWTFERRIEVFIAVLRALAFAHARGIVHRDLKPSNIIVGRYGEVWLMDWGVAKSRQRGAFDALREPGGERPADDPKASMFTTRHGTLVGTPAYMSPEQARGDIAAIDERSDLYSACVTFLELISLKHYLGNKSTVAEMLVAIASDPAPTIGTLAVNVHPVQGSAPAELLHICVHGLQKDPAARFQSAEALIARLEATLAGEVQVQCPYTFTKRAAREAGRMVDRRPLTAVMMFAGTVLALLWAVAATVLLVMRSRGHG
jgi:serine/threonine-protein kinase